MSMRVPGVTSWKYLLHDEVEGTPKMTQDCWTAQIFHQAKVLLPEVQQLLSSVPRRTVVGRGGDAVNFTLFQTFFWDSFSALLEMKYWFVMFVFWFSVYSVWSQSISLKLSEMGSRHGSEERRTLMKKLIKEGKTNKEVQKMRLLNQNHLKETIEVRVMMKTSPSMHLK